MSIRLLKLSNEKGTYDSLTSSDILSIHLGYYMIKGKVTYSTGISIAYKPDYVILALKDIEDVCFLCHVDKYDYKGKDLFFTPDDEEFIEYLPEKYKDYDNISWLLFDSIEKVSTDFLDQIHPHEKISEVIRSRANNKEL